MNEILVTGGSGFLGRYLNKRLLDKYKNVRIKMISRDENDIAKTMGICRDSRLTPIVGDIRDSDALKFALKGVDSVIHLAAMKHIDLCELNSMEAITINVVGTMNLLKLFEGDTFVGMSTDKVVEATGCYGATKLLTEKLIQEKAKRNGVCRYMVVRSGNIFGSSGSVVDKWRQQIRQGNEIIVTNFEMTRFFIDVDVLADFIIDVLEQGKSGNVYIPSQKVIKLEDLAKATIELCGDGKTKMKVVGMTKGEKLHEKLFGEGEEDLVVDLQDRSSERGERLSISEIKELLRKCDEG